MDRCVVISLVWGYMWRMCIGEKFNVECRSKYNQTSLHGDFHNRDSGKKTKVQFNGEKDSEHVIPSYPVCPSLKKKPLLSDE